MVKKILLTILLMITQSLVNSQQQRQQEREQEVPDINQFRYSQTAPGNGMVRATPPASPIPERDVPQDSDNDEASDSKDDQVVPERAESDH